MTRYVKQRDDFRCGPVSIINSMKWAGKSVSYAESIARLSKLCKTDTHPISERGTFISDYVSVLRRYAKGKFKFALVKRPTLTAIKTNLSQGKAIIVVHKLCFEEDGHYSFLVDYSRKAKVITVVNGFLNDRRYLKNRKYHRTVHRCPLDMFKKRMVARQRYDGDHYRCWVLTKLKPAKAKRSASKRKASKSP